MAVLCTHVFHELFAGLIISLALFKRLPFRPRALGAEIGIGGHGRANRTGSTNGLPRRTPTAQLLTRTAYFFTLSDSAKRKFRETNKGVGPNEKKVSAAVEFVSFRRIRETRNSKRIFWRNPNPVQRLSVLYSGCIGLASTCGCFRSALIKRPNKRQYLGKFHEERDAALAYDVKARKLGRETNFPEASTRSASSVDVNKKTSRGSSNQISSRSSREREATSVSCSTKGQESATSFSYADLVSVAHAVRVIEVGRRACDDAHTRTHSRSSWR